MERLYAKKFPYAVFSYKNNRDGEREVTLCGFGLTLDEAKIKAQNISDARKCETQVRDVDYRPMYVCQPNHVDWLSSGF